MRQELISALRTLYRAPGFSIAGVILLLFAIGGNTALFSVIDPLLLRSLPYPNGDRIVLIEESNKAEGLQHFKISPADFGEIQKNDKAFESVASFNIGDVVLSGTRPERLQAAEVSADFFRVLGINPILGRSFTTDDDRPGIANTVIIGYSLWQREFGGDHAILGHVIRLSGENYIVVGVLPASFSFLDLYGSVPEIWAPAKYEQEYLASHGHEIAVIACLKPGTKLAAARTEMNVLARRLAASNPISNSGWDIEVVNLQDRLSAEIKPYLFMLLTGLLFILFIAVVNMANLLTARAFLNNREIAIRLALGASRASVLRQFVWEGILISLVGGFLGLVLAYVGMPVLLHLSDLSLPLLNTITINWRVLGFAFFLSLLTGFVFGIIPGTFTFKAPINDTLREGSGPNLGSRSRKSGQRVLLILETSLTLILLVLAGLSIDSFVSLLHVDNGFDPKGVLTLRLSLPSVRYSTREQMTNFTEKLLAGVRTLPSVRAAGLSHTFPLVHDMNFSFTAEGSELPIGQDAPSANVFMVTPGYFQAMGIPLQRGRNFTDQDRGGALPVAIVSETFARQFFPQKDPIGKRIKEGATDSHAPWLTIVGVVRDVRDHGLAQAPLPQIYESYNQRPFSFLTLAVKTEKSPLDLVPAVEQQIYQLDREQPAYEIRTLEDIVANSLAPWKLSMELLSLFGLMSLALAATGVYGVVTYAISQRRHELGIRAALGATRGGLFTLLLKEVLLLSGTGVIIGAAISVAIIRPLSAALYGAVHAVIPQLILCSVLLLGVSGVAALRPAIRAAAGDPMQALRDQ